MYTTLAQQQSEALKTEPSMAFDLMVELLPSPVQQEIRKDVRGVATWEHSTRGFADEWLNGSEIGLWATILLITVMSVPDLVLPNLRTTLDNQLIRGITIPGKAAEPSDRKLRSVVRLARNLIKSQGYTRHKWGTLMNVAREWAAIQVKFDGSLNVALADTWFKRRYGRLATNVSSAIAPFDHAFGIRRTPGPPKESAEELGSDIPEFGHQRNEPTRW